MDIQMGAMVVQDCKQEWMLGRIQRHAELDLRRSLPKETIAGGRMRRIERWIEQLQMQH